MNTKIIVSYELTIDETGAIIDTQLLSKTTTTINTVPKVTLTKNKLKLNDYALACLGVNKGNLIDIRYDDNGPLIGKASDFNIQSGNKITAAGTVSFRGEQNEVLSKYGEEFTLIKQDDGTFRLSPINNNPFTFKTF